MKLNDKRRFTISHFPFHPLSRLTQLGIDKTVTVTVTHGHDHARDRDRDHRRRDRE